MKTHKLILVFLLYSAIALCQNRKDNGRLQLDSMREEILAPKLRKYVQQVEKFEKQMGASTQKKDVKEYAREIVQISDAMEDEVASLYDDFNYPRGGYYLSGMMSPWGFYPGFGGMFYPGNYYYANFPPVYYDVERVRHFANNIRMFSWPANVRRKEAFIYQKLQVLKSETEIEHPVSMK